MKVSLKKRADMPTIIDNSFAFDCFKRQVRSELHQLDVLTSLMKDELTDSEYAQKAIEVYSAEPENDYEVANCNRILRECTKPRLKSDRDLISAGLQEALEYLKRWSIESSKLTRERLNIEEQTAEYCDTLLNGFAKEKKQLHNQ